MDTIDILKGVTMVLDVLTNEDILLDGYGDISPIFFELPIPYLITLNSFLIQFGHEMASFNRYISMLYKTELPIKYDEFIIFYKKVEKDIKLNLVLEH